VGGEVGVEDADGKLELAPLAGIDAEHEVLYVLVERRQPERVAHGVAHWDALIGAGACGRGDSLGKPFELKLVLLLVHLGLGVGLYGGEVDFLLLCLVAHIEVEGDLLVLFV